MRINIYFFAIKFLKIYTVLAGLKTFKLELLLIYKIGRNQYLFYMIFKFLGFSSGFLTKDFGLGSNGCGNSVEKLKTCFEHCFLVT